MTKEIHSEDIKWQYDDVYYRGGVSKFTGKKIGGVFGSKDFGNGKIHPSKIKNAHTLYFKNRKLLDVGFARGEMLKYCADNGAKLCVGIDYSNTAVKIAKSWIKNKNVKVFEMSVTNVNKLKQKNFDLVYMMDVLEHVSTSEWHIFFEKIKSKVTRDVVFTAETPCYDHGAYMEMHNNYFEKDDLYKLFKTHFEDVVIHTGNNFNDKPKIMSFMVMATNIKMEK